MHIPRTKRVRSLPGQVNLSRSQALQLQYHPSLSPVESASCPIPSPSLRDMGQKLGFECHVYAHPGRSAPALMDLPRHLQ